MLQRGEGQGINKAMVRVAAEGAQNVVLALPVQHHVPESRLQPVVQTVGSMFVHF